MSEQDMCPPSSPELVVGKDQSAERQAGMTVAPKHTPGPWEVVDMTDRGEGYKVQAPKAHYSRSNIAHFMSKADAQLIAASPRLLEACLAVVENYDEGLGDEQSVARLCRTVINEALSAQPQSSDDTFPMTNVSEEGGHSHV